jgi:hypothetical protein
VLAVARADALTAPWERRVGNAYENRGLARIERLGDRWVLTVFCDGTHSTYLEADGAIDPSRHATRYVSVRYRYVDRPLDDPTCLRAPCSPVLERRIVLERVKALAATRAEAEARVTQCDPTRPGKGQP